MKNTNDFLNFAFMLLFVSVLSCLIVIFLTTKEVYNRGFADGKYYCERMIARTGGYSV